jgi:hypothetical protein
LQFEFPRTFDVESRSVDDVGNHAAAREKKDRVATKETAETGTDVAENILEILRLRSPNLTLNVPDDISNLIKVWTVACMGFVIQVVVMVINTVVVYGWKWLRPGSLVASYGYPTWAVGTVCITFGVTLCAYVIQSSTEPYAAEPKGFLIW